MYGYYFFMGRGDWGTSREKTFDPSFNGNVPTSLIGDWGPHRQGTTLAEAPEWTSAWSLATWKAHIDFLIDELEADTLVILMNGYELPYPSARFPEAVEIDHANVREEFFQHVLEYALKRGMQLYAQFCTTGHAVGYATAHPEYTTVAADGARHDVNLCHHHPAGRAYVTGVIEEVLTRYRGFTGISFHPPENASPCYCQYCQAAFEQTTGSAFAEATSEAISDFYWSSCLHFQREMEVYVQGFIPDVKLLCITIPGRFEQDFSIIAPEIPRSTLIMHWDYWSFGERLPELLESLRLFSSCGHQVGFIPSSGWSLEKCGPLYGEQVVTQIDAVRKQGVQDIFYFVGGIWHEPSLLATSYARHVGVSTR